ncbi:Very-short-patch-repair endonuclease [Sporobacter termitidis DSM 10068]|uniref:Very-short-patch-repair endonuclease n=1 Tax=Sporobacter termitidis DSM 10068 TaxID=1123282 RepID=A0A1M5XQ67_9FIRM|nr:endonuclease domain-containing protein [Sporobacter termitidis]SHI01668.1 Very-short-patch-repair endonuclease [Sporobacter termitidis DSM 10068]
MSLEYNRALIDRAKELRRSLTPQERKLWYEFLSAYPVRFQRQKVIDSYIADFYCAKAKLIIELDGSGHFEPEQKEYDAIRTEILNAYGLTVIRFTNLEIERNFSAVCSAIENSVKESLLQLLENDGATQSFSKPPSVEGGGAAKPRRKE